MCAAWRRDSSVRWEWTTKDRRREISLFTIVGLARSVVTLVISRDVLGLNSHLADSISATAIGLAPGAAGYWSCKTRGFQARLSRRQAASLPVVTKWTDEHVGAGPAFQE